MTEGSYRPICWRGLCFEFQARADGRNVYSCSHGRVIEWGETEYYAELHGTTGPLATSAEAALEAAADKLRRRLERDTRFLSEIA